MSAPSTQRTTLEPFTITSPLGTDIWRKPPNINVFTAPTHPSPLLKHPLISFYRTRLTVSLPPTFTLRQFDQAGLILHFTSLDPTKQDKWIKTGLEFYNGRSWISTAGCDAWSDWSVVPMDVGDADGPKVTVEAERTGKSLWVYQIVKAADGKEERLPLRELNWVFAEEAAWDVGIGGFVARETQGEGSNELVGRFEDGLVVEVLVE
ncbi:hypothetical protein DE146DRAFT_664388 [Phaeosphaeria sp. MPI-PUGE-AT-0046c]|nr:hypothetical protein DE146DRAFT_664388 [Phaeosphaeria sp. MPI-PUGE-AT-0046c]